MNNNKHGIQFSPRVLHQQNGFTLVEIMIGATLGLFLTAGLIQFFLGNKQTYIMHENTSRIQENGRFALELLNTSIRMTNFTGCPLKNGTGASVTVENVLNNNTIDWWKNFNTNWAGSLIGYDGNNNFPGYVTGTSSKQRINGTDAIIVLGGGGSYTIDSTSVPSPSTLTLTQLKKTNGSSLKAGDLVIVCNSTNTSLFQVTTINGLVIDHANTAGFTPGNSTSSLFSYTPTQATMVDYVPTAFYIGVSTSETTKSLYQLQLSVDSNKIAAMETQEMVEGVEDMQIFYGEDTTGDSIPDVYRDATNVIPPWNRVVSVRINLLLVSLEDNVVGQPQSYLFPKDTGDATISGRTHLASDRRFYQVVSTTIGIRNRLP